MNKSVAAVLIAIFFVLIFTTVKNFSRIAARHAHIPHPEEAQAAPLHTLAPIFVAQEKVQQKVDAKREMAAVKNTVKGPVKDSITKDSGPAFSAPQSLEARKIKSLYPEINNIDPKEFLNRLAVTDFPENGQVEFLGGDSQFQTYGYKSNHDEDVEKWYWTEDGSVAVEQIEYSPNEKVVRRYFDHSGIMSEVSYEYGNSGGVVRYRDNGTMESYQTWKAPNNASGSGSTASNTLVRYDDRGEPVETWHMNGNDWVQE